MKIILIRLTAGLILQIEYLCLVGVIQFTDGNIPVRLVNPSSSLSNPFAGRLQVWYNGAWGTVCDDEFTDAAARVVCASLGFGRTGKFIHNAFGSGTGSIWLDDVVCTGNETSIESCRRSSWGSHDCGHNEDVSISCGYIPVRLINPGSSLSNPIAGRLEVQSYTGTWGTVCDDDFTDAAARVVCARLGFGRTGSVIQNQYGFGTGPIFLDDVVCNGSEIDIDDCSHKPWGSHDCNHPEDVAISCIDIDECSTRQSQCNALSTICVNTVGSYRCSCRSGFRTMNSTSCTDIDECSTRQSQCNASSTVCVNTVGSYRCSCRSGFRTMNSTSCTDIDECSTGQSQCASATTTCINTFGSYRCSCRNGYTAMTLTSCTDIDECSTGQSQCDSATATCVNKVGGYDCSCKSGYRHLNSLFCTDIDECSIRQPQCNASSTICVNTVGSYRCSCRSGFRTMNSTSCTDTDECASGDSECDMVSTDCTNTIGNYTCRCKMGFAYLNETTCFGLGKESSDGSFGIFVGSSAAGAILVIASIAILFLVFYWKRRREVNQPQMMECSGVDNCRRPDDGNYKISNIYNMPLEPTECDMTGKRTDSTRNNACARLPAPNEKSKRTAESAIGEYVQPDIYANVQSAIDEDDESAIYENFLD